jgi:hypothetical protein
MPLNMLDEFAAGYETDKSSVAPARLSAKPTPLLINEWRWFRCW